MTVQNVGDTDLAARDDSIIKAKDHDSRVPLIFCSKDPAQLQRACPSLPLPLPLTHTSPSPSPSLSSAGPPSPAGFAGEPRMHAVGR
jgi:hypothetical protein